MPAASFTKNILVLFAGPIVWAVHFVAMYGFAGIMCARPAVAGRWLGIDFISGGIIAFSLLAIVILGLIYLRWGPQDSSQDNLQFIRWMSPALSLFAVIAIIWETLPVFLVPIC